MSVSVLVLLPEKEVGLPPVPSHLSPGNPLFGRPRPFRDSVSPDGRDSKDVQRSGPGTRPKVDPEPRLFAAPTPPHRSSPATQTHSLERPRRPDARVFQGTCARVCVTGVCQAPSAGV